MTLFDILWIEASAITIVAIACACRRNDDLWTGFTGGWIGATVLWGGLHFRFLYPG